VLGLNYTKGVMICLLVIPATKPKCKKAGLIEEVKGDELESVSGKQ
jgi:hypothetical protein